MNSIFFIYKKRIYVCTTFVSPHTCISPTAINRNSLLRCIGDSPIRDLWRRRPRVKLRAAALIYLEKGSRFIIIGYDEKFDTHTTSIIRRLVPGSTLNTILLGVYTLGITEAKQLGLRGGDTENKKLRTATIHRTESKA